jgi:hypothetical protein
MKDDSYHLVVEQQESREHAEIVHHHFGFKSPIAFERCKILHIIKFNRGNIYQHGQYLLIHVLQHHRFNWEIAELF